MGTDVAILRFYESVSKIAPAGLGFAEGDGGQVVATLLAMTVGGVLD